MATDIEPRGGIEPTPSGWDYAPAPESRDVVTLRERYGLFIGGRFVEPLSDRWFTTIDPSTEEPLASVAEAGEADVDLAVASAREASETFWRDLSGRERAKHLYRIARSLQERAREFAVLESLNGGKPIKESRDVDVPLAAAHFFYHAGWADKLGYAFPGRTGRPLGVAGQVIPWNFPLLMAAWKLAPALACGNTCVLKPAETTPLTALLLAEVIREADLPPGVVNIVTGAGETGAALVAHPGLDKVAFTGSTEVGKRIRRTLAGTGRRLTLELGGKAANIVFDDAPIDQAIEGIVNGIYFNQGHVCCAGSRLLVQESVFEPVVEKLKERLGTLRVGPPLDKNTDVGAINSRAQLDRITDLVRSGVEEGAEMFQASCDLPEHGFWFRPTFFTGVSQSHRIAREEIFGPVLSILTFRTPAEAVEKANNTPYGLSAGIWTEKGSRILWMAERMRAGVVWANTFNRFDPSAPFGGYKESGFGREGGLHGLEAYLDLEPGAAREEAASTNVTPSARSRSRGAGSVAGHDARLPVRKTYKLAIGGAFPRSESGRTYPVLGADGEVLARPALASRKDLRDAVQAARGAFGSWSGATAYNRGQVLYRVAELMEGRREQFVDELVAFGTAGEDAEREVTGAIDRWVWYAGWSDKVHHVLGTVNPVAGPYYTFTFPEPTGVVGVVAPEEPALLGFVSRVAPAIVSGNAVVAVASETRPLPAVTLSEVLATSDVPGGVVNLLTGSKAELLPWLAGHMDVNALDLTGAPADRLTDLETLAAENVKRTVRAPAGDPFDDDAAETPYAISALMEMKTVWHPMGA